MTSFLNDVFSKLKKHITNIKAVLYTKNERTAEKKSHSSNTLSFPVERHSFCREIKK